MTVRTLTIATLLAACSAAPRPTPMPDPQAARREPEEVSAPAATPRSFLWELTNRGSRNTREEIALGSDGTLYVGGRFVEELELQGAALPSMGNGRRHGDGYVLALDPAGGVRWATRFGGLGVDRVARLTAVPGGVLVSAGGEGSIHFFGREVRGEAMPSARLDRDGHPLWVTEIELPGRFRIRNLVVDARGTSFVAGVSHEDEGSGVLASVTGDGAIAWQMSSVAPLGDDAALAVRPDGAVAVRGRSVVTALSEQEVGEDAPARELVIAADGSLGAPRPTNLPKHRGAITTPSGATYLYGDSWAPSDGGGRATRSHWVAAVEADNTLRWVRPSPVRVTDLAWGEGVLVVSGSARGELRIDGEARPLTDLDGVLRGLEPAHGEPRWTRIIGGRGNQSVDRVAAGGGALAALVTSGDRVDFGELSTQSRRFLLRLEGGVAEPNGQPDVVFERPLPSVEGHALRGTEEFEARRIGDDPPSSNPDASPAVVAPSARERSVYAALIAETRRTHALTVTPIGVAVLDGPNGARATLLYEYGRFERFRAVHRRARTWTATTRRAARAEASCLRRRAREAAAAMRRARRLEAIAERTGDDDDLDAAEEAFADASSYEADEGEGISPCNGMERVFEGAAESLECRRDRLAVATYPLDETGASPRLGPRLALHEVPTCRAYYVVDEEGEAEVRAEAEAVQLTAPIPDWPGALPVLDLDGDDVPEVVVRAPRLEPFSVGRWTIIGAESEEQLWVLDSEGACELTAAFDIDRERTLRPVAFRRAHWTRTFFEDVDGDDHRDLVQETQHFETNCTCRAVMGHPRLGPAISRAVADPDPLRSSTLFCSSATAPQQIEYWCRPSGPPERDVRLYVPAEGAWASEEPATSPSDG